MELQPPGATTCTPCEDRTGPPLPPQAEAMTLRARRGIRTRRIRGNTAGRLGRVPRHNLTRDGSYAGRARRERRDVHPHRQIQPAFEAMLATTVADDTRPSLEFYRRCDEIDLLLPVASE